MNLEELIKNNLNIDSSKIYFNEPIAKYTSFKIGGNAECLIKIETQEQIKELLKFINNNNIPLTILGNGSNVLVLDAGIKGIVAKIEIKKIEIKEQNEKIEVTVGAGNKNAELAGILLKNEITGFEEIAGIPGTIGGAIRMNAGAYGKEIKELVKTVTIMDYNGNKKVLTKEQMQFEYRNSIISKEKYIVLETVLELQKGKAQEIKQKMAEYLENRKEKQPLEFPSAGSTFKRGENFVTAKLIDECNLKGYKVGGAEISTKHAGFIINTGNATAKDVLNLAKHVKEEVYKKFNKKIELEIEILGEGN
ncbi:MAG: UDP-N-acetylmuramate dehydrogenase [Clostridia bacterium]|nr:UDP-N-acetylmuramate dehydrogenase [Clostridia bacterium]